MKILAHFVVLGMSIYQVFGQESLPTVAVIIGGYDLDRLGGVVRNEVEIFGCGDGTTAVNLADFPYQIHASGGVYWSSMNAVVVCGGRICEEEICYTATDRCWTLDIDIDNGSDTWREIGSMTIPRWYHLMLEGPLVDDEENHLIIMGYQEQSDYYDTALEAFVPYKDSPGGNWLTLNGLIHIDGVIYEFNDDDTVNELFVADWRREPLAPLPEPLKRPGRVAEATIDGVKGIYSKDGFWFNLQTASFEQKTPPPQFPIVNDVNSMHSYRGGPTVFGTAFCNSNAECSNVLVHSYNSETGLWDLIGQMNLSRRDHLVVEVPGTFCASLGLDPPEPQVNPTTVTASVNPSTVTTSEEPGTTTKDSQAKMSSAGLVVFLSFILTYVLSLSVE